jgi:hypothetical protein
VTGSKADAPLQRLFEQEEAAWQTEPRVAAAANALGLPRRQQVQPSPQPVIDMMRLWCESKLLFLRVRCKAAQIKEAPAHITSLQEAQKGFVQLMSHHDEMLALCRESRSCKAELDVLQMVSTSTTFYLN